MLEDGLRRVLALPDGARVLDVGGWAAPLNRADWVIDLMPYASRGAIAPHGVGPLPERFTPDTWIEADICSHDAWPFADDSFDFAVCTFTLEDVRDPIRVCQEVSRVARAGYVEVPSLLDELTWHNPEVSGGPWVGHAHHRWLCFVNDGELLFLSKFHSLHARTRAQVPPGWAHRLSVQDRVLAHFWEGSLPARERPAIDDYPFAELERVIVERFGRSPSRTDRLRDRGERAARHAIGKLRRGNAAYTTSDR